MIYVINASQHVKSPTRLDAILDLVITSEPDLVHEVEATAPLESSDHNMISWKCRVETSQIPTRLTRPNYKRANMDAIRKNCNRWTGTYCWMETSTLAGEILEM